MNADEIVRALRAAAAKWEAKNKFIGTGELRVHDALNDAADLIESLQAQLAESQRCAEESRSLWKSRLMSQNLHARIWSGTFAGKELPQKKGKRNNG